MNANNTKIWYTINNLKGDNWSEFFDNFVDAETDHDQHDNDEDAILAAQVLTLRGQKRHVVTKHSVARDGVEHTTVVWEA